MGARLRRLFVERWPAYQQWMRRADSMPIADCVTALRTHMPELVPLFERLLALVEGGEDEARFLSLYCPPRLIRACSQIVLDTPDGPTLLRSYDFAPHLCDGIVLASQWSGMTTTVVTDCLWGALDGINQHGLAAALAFGGRSAIGPGFAAPLLIRYILETCATVADAQRILRRVPVAMPYTFVVADAEGGVVTAFLSPDRDAVFGPARASTNHQSESDWPAYQRFSGTVERLSYLNELLQRHAPFDECLQAFLQPPIWRTRYAQGAGTLYVAEYQLAARSLTLHWPGQAESFSAMRGEERTIRVELPKFDRAPNA